MTDQDISGGFSPVETTKPEQNTRLMQKSRSINHPMGGLFRIAIAILGY